MFMNLNDVVGVLAWIVLGALGRRSADVDIRDEGEVVRGPLHGGEARGALGDLLFRRREVDRAGRAGPTY